MVPAAEPGSNQAHYVPQTPFTQVLNGCSTPLSHPQRISLAAGTAFSTVRRMRPIWIVLIYVRSVFVLGALLAPWLYWSAQVAAPLGPAFQYFADSPFHRYVLRSILVVALLGIWIVSRYAGIRSWRDLGFETHRRSGRQFGAGLLLG